MGRSGRWLGTCASHHTTPHTPRHHMCPSASLIKGSEADRINLTNVACWESWHCSVSFCPADRSSEINMSDTHTPYDISQRQTDPVRSIYKRDFRKCNCLPYYYPRLDLLFAAKLAPKHSSTDYKVRRKNDWNNGENVDNMNLSNETYNSYEEEAVNFFSVHLLVNSFRLVFLAVKY